MNNIPSFADHIMHLVAKDQMRKAIQEAQDLFKGSPKFYELVLQSARYSDIMESIRLGLINIDDATIEKNKIRYALIDMLRELEETTVSNSAVQEEVNTYLNDHQTVIRNNTTLTGDNNMNIQGVTGSNINIQTGKNNEKE